MSVNPIADESKTSKIPPKRIPRMREKDDTKLTAETSSNSKEHWLAVRTRLRCGMKGGAAKVKAEGEDERWH